MEEKHVVRRLIMGKTKSYKEHLLNKCSRNPSPLGEGQVSHFMVLTKI